jgi:hypothetical protein
VARYWRWLAGRPTAGAETDDFGLNRESAQRANESPTPTGSSRRCGASRLVARMAAANRFCAPETPATVHCCRRRRQQCTAEFRAGQHDKIMNIAENRQSQYNTTAAELFSVALEGMRRCWRWSLPLWLWLSSSRLDSARARPLRAVRNGRCSPRSSQQRLALVHGGPPSNGSGGAPTGPGWLGSATMSGLVVSQLVDSAARANIVSFADGLERGDAMCCQRRRRALAASRAELGNKEAASRRRKVLEFVALGAGRRAAAKSCPNARRMMNGPALLERRP